MSERSRVISALGIVQIFNWGSTYYLLAVLAGPIQRGTGWSAEAVTAGISIGLLISGLVARRVGRLIQTHGGRLVLAGGVGCIAAGLVMLGLAQTFGLYLAAWIVIGLGMGAGLYDAAFSTLGRLYGHEARRAITVLTLWGGFASTVCWPISAFLVDALGWRGACFAYTGLHLGVTLPLCLFALPRKVPPLPSSPGRSRPDGDTLIHDPRLWLIAVAGVTLAVLAALWSIHVMTILKADGYGLAAAVGLGVFIGPSQVAARVIEMLSGGRHHPAWTMMAATGLVAAGFAGLLVGAPAAAALVAYGAGNGLWSIARGALPLAIFDPQDYALVMGRLARPTLIASAAAPLVGSALLDHLGPYGTLDTLAVVSVLPLAAAILLVLIIRREAGAQLKAF
ncbi:MAG: MFS transporter [Rhodobacteraceae bacterium]|nr:MFS transporter [Paracoccaceae bacterium]